MADRRFSSCIERRNPHAFPPVLLAGALSVFASFASSACASSEDEPAGSEGPQRFAVGTAAHLDAFFGAELRGGDAGWFFEPLPFDEAEVTHGGSFGGSE